MSDPEFDRLLTRWAFQGWKYSFRGGKHLEHDVITVEQYDFFWDRLKCFKRYFFSLLNAGVKQIIHERRSDARRAFRRAFNHKIIKS
jgi:hypothetical protein